MDREVEIEGEEEEEGERKEKEEGEEDLAIARMQVGERETSYTCIERSSKACIP